MKNLYLLLCLLATISCGAAPEQDFDVSKSISTGSQEIVIGNSEDSLYEDDINLEESDSLDNDEIEIDLEDNTTDDLQPNLPNEETSSNPLLASKVYDIHGDLYSVESLYEQSDFAVIALFEQNCALCEVMSLNLEKNQRMQQLVSSSRCELSIVFDDFGGENNVLESVAQNLPDFVASRSFVRSNNFMNFKHFGPLFLIINKQGEIVKQMRTLTVVENFCRQ